MAFKDLERMPKGRAIYIGPQNQFRAVQGTGNAYGGGSSGQGRNESKEIAGVLEELAKAGPSDRLDGYAFPMTGLQIYHYDDPAKAVAAQTEALQGHGERRSQSVRILKEKPVLKRDAEKFGEFKLHSMQMARDFEKMAEPMPHREAKRRRSSTSRP